MAATSPRRRNRDTRAENKRRRELAATYGISSRSAYGKALPGERKLADVRANWDPLPTQGGGEGREVFGFGAGQASRLARYGHDLARLGQREIDDHVFDDRWAGRIIGRDEDGEPVRGASAADARA